MIKWILIVWQFSLGAPNDIEVLGSFNYEDDCTAALEQWLDHYEGHKGICLKTKGMGK